MKYSRVLTTSQAIEQCYKASDYKVRTGGRNYTSLGRKSLKIAFERQKALERHGETKIWTVHKGDFPFEIAAKNIVGFVAWDNVPLAMYKEGGFAKCCKELLRKGNKAMTVPGELKE